MLKQIAAITGEELEYRLRVGQHRFFNRSNPPQKILVNGSPKTGTTWMVNLLSSLPGYQAVGNFKGDGAHYRETLPGSVIHGHEPYTNELWSTLQSYGIQVVLMIRDPRDQTISRLFHIRRDTTHRWHHQLNQLSEREALMACIEGRPDLTSAATLIKLSTIWLSEVESLGCVRYEDLVLNPTDEFSMLLRSLDINIPPTLAHLIVRRNRFERLVIGRKIWKSGRRPGQENPNSHYRKGITGDWVNYFQSEHIQRFKEVAGDGLITLGYEQDSDW